MVIKIISRKEQGTNNVILTSTRKWEIMGYHNLEERSSSAAFYMLKKNLLVELWLMWPSPSKNCLVYVFILWRASQRSILKVCLFAGLNLWECSELCITAEFVVIMLFHLENVCHQGLSIPSFAEGESCVSTHVCGEEVNPEIMEWGMTSKLAYYG